MRRTIQLNAVRIIVAIVLLCATYVFAQFIARHTSNLSRSSAGYAATDSKKTVVPPRPHKPSSIPDSSGLSTSRGNHPPSRPMLLYDRWRSFTTKDGLPSDDTKCVRVDGDRVWVGTDEGLALYEGGVWRAYGVKDGLPHRIVLSLDVSEQTGDLWVGTAGGLARFSGGRFENFNQMNSGLANDVVYGISCLGDDVWVATASGVSRYNVRRRDWAIFNNNNTIMFEPWTYAISAKDGMVYVGVWGGGVVEYSYKTNFWKDYHDPDGELEIDLFKDDGPTHEVIPAVSYENGMLWVGSYFGLSTYDGRHWKNYYKTDSGLASDFINFVRARGHIGWICTDDGLSSFDGTTWATYRKGDAGGELRISRGSRVMEKRRLPQSLAHNYTLGVDFQGDDVWVATAQGVSRGSPSSRSRYELMTKKMPLSD